MELTRRNRLQIHPLFFIALVLSAFTGDFLLFVCATVAAVEHECAHAFVARRYGFALDKIVLMPYGAVISGDLAGITKKEEIAVCLAGPLANAVTALFFVALWWLYPESYPYTDVAAHISLSLFLVNLLPAFPLDGGRILHALLRPLGEKRARVICLCVSGAAVCALLGVFISSCFSCPNFSLLFFCAFLIFGAFGGGKYGRVPFLRAKNFMRGVEEVRVALFYRAPISSALRYLREDKHFIFVLYEGEDFYGEVMEEELLCVYEKKGENVPLCECLSQFKT